jgi:hypothetical protein
LSIRSIGEIAEAVAVRASATTPGPAGLDFDQTSPLAAKSNIPATTAVSLPLGFLWKTMTYFLFSDAIETSEPRSLTCRQGREKIGVHVDLYGNYRRKLRDDQNRKGYRWQRRFHDAAPSPMVVQAIPKGHIN